jgi:chromosome segregation ATPase
VDLGVGGLGAATFGTALSTSGGTPARGYDDPRVRALQVAHNDLSDALAKERRDNDKLKADKDKLLAQIDGLKRDLADHKPQLDKANADRDAAEAKAAALQKQVDGLLRDEGSVSLKIHWFLSRK